MAYSTPTDMQFFAGKNVRVFVNEKEVPVMRAGVNPGSAKRQEFQHSLSLGGTDVKGGMKSAPTFTINVEYDLKNDPFNTAGLNIRGGQTLAKIEIFPYGGELATPSGPKHVILNALIEDTPFDVTIEGKPTFQFSGCCSTRDYTYTPMDDE